MPFVPVKCTSCGGDIQLDDQRQTGFCSYCGAQVIFEEAIKQMKIMGSVTVEGIATLEKKLEDAATFNKLGNNNRERELLQKITDEYPGDYRGWWQLALNRQSGMRYDPSVYALFSGYHFPSEDDRIEQFKIICEYINNAITLAPPEKSHDLKARAKECYEKELKFLEGGLGYWEDRRNKLIEVKNDKQKYDRAVRAIYRRGSETYKRARVQRGALAIGLFVLNLIFVINLLPTMDGGEIFVILMQFPTTFFILVIVGGLRTSGSLSRDRGFRAWHHESWYYDRAWKESGIKKDRYNNFSEKENTRAIESQGTIIERLQKQIAKIRELIVQLQV